MQCPDQKPNGLQLQDCYRFRPERGAIREISDYMFSGVQMQFTGVILYTKDIRQLTAFYRDVLGVQAAAEQPFDPKRFFIFGEQERSTLALHSGTKPNGGRAKLSFYVDDLVKVRERLMTAGLKLGAYDPPTGIGGGILNLKDPEGNRVIICGRMS